MDKLEKVIEGCIEKLSITIVEEYNWEHDLDGDACYLASPIAQVVRKYLERERWIKLPDLTKEEEELINRCRRWGTFK